VLARLVMGNCNDVWTLFRGARIEAVLRGCNYQAAAIGERGEIAYFANSQRGQGLSLRKADGSVQVLLAEGESIPGFGTIGYASSMAVTPLGHVRFENCNSQGCYQFLWNGSK